MLVGGDGIKKTGYAKRGLHEHGGGTLNILYKLKEIC